jgi:hypothetical protein
LRIDTQAPDSDPGAVPGHHIREATMADIAKYVDKAHEQKEFADLAELPIDALQGVSKADADAIQRAFGVKTIRQLAEHKFVRAAQAITLLAGVK